MADFAPPDDNNRACEPEGTTSGKVADKRYNSPKPMEPNRRPRKADGQRRNNVFDKRSNVRGPARHGK
ncbi:MAG: exopolyphosphatase, partial [Erythrobacteraceae bacterium]|nr:exopolyphosphatase [Erythrobacteraceae bacterium]